MARPDRWKWNPETRNYDIPEYGPERGDHTGRCMKCGSEDLWDDNLSYGCKTCGEIYIRS